MPLKLKIGLGRKIPGPIQFLMFEATAGFELDVDEALLGSDPEAVRNKMRSLWLKASAGIDEELERQLDSYRNRQHEKAADEPPTTRPDYQNGDRVIDEARSRAEPAAARNGHTNGNGYTKQRTDYQGGYKPQGDGGRGPTDAGKTYGPPKNGAALMAWAKGLEEKGEASGLVKWIIYGWGKAAGLANIKVLEWPPNAVRDCYDDALRRSEGGN